MIFAGSIAAIRKTVDSGQITNNFQHAPITVEASSKSEAIGMCLQIAWKLYPKHDGWGHHDAQAQDALNFVVKNPEDAILVKVK